MARRKRPLSQATRHGGSDTEEVVEPSKPLRRQSELAGREHERAKNVAMFVEMLREKGLGDILASKLRRHVCRKEDLTVPSNKGSVPYELALDALVSRNEELIHKSLTCSTQRDMFGRYSSSSSSSSSSSQPRQGLQAAQAASSHAQQVSSQQVSMVVELSRRAHSALTSQDPCNGVETVDKICEVVANAKAESGVLARIQDTLSESLEMAEQTQMEAEEEVGTFNSIVQAAQDHAESAEERVKALDRKFARLNEELKKLQAERDSVLSERHATRAQVMEQTRIVAENRTGCERAQERQVAAAVKVTEARERVKALEEVISNLDAALAASRQGAQERWKAHVARLRLWTAKEVSHWIRHYQNGRWAQHADEFEASGVHGELLQTLTSTDLRDLGVRQLDKRRALSLAIKELLSEAGLSCRPQSGDETQEVAKGTAANESPPAELICPITCMLVKEPVAVRGDDTGHAYELASIRRWFAEGNRTVPLTNEPLLSSSDRELLPLREHARRAAEWRRLHPEETSLKQQPKQKQKG